MKPTKVFLSYARNDDDPAYDDPTRSFVRRLYNDLVEAGFDVWWDREKMPTRGQPFPREIREAIEETDKLILIAGEYAQKSEYVTAEWKHALSICIPVIPILRENNTGLLPDELAYYNAVHFSDPVQYDRAFKELLRIVRMPTAPSGRRYGLGRMPRGYVARYSHLNTVIESITSTDKQMERDSLSQNITALVGMGGIGKTTLAKALCHDCRIQRAFPDGIVWMEMGQNPSLITKQATLGTTFGDSAEKYQNEEQGKIRLSEVLGQKQISRLLLVLDDVWDHKHVNIFPDMGENSHILITTRSERLAVLTGAERVAVNRLTDDEGINMIGKWLRLRPEETETHASLRPIVNILQGHALAVEVSAALLAERTIHYLPQLIERLETNLDSGGLFEDLQLDPNDKDANVERSLVLSYDGLTDNWKQRFRALGTLAPDTAFDTAIAAAIWGDTPVEIHKTQDALNALSRFSLLTEEVPGKRYTQHGLLRAYARALAVKAGEFQTYYDRYLEYVIETVTQPDKMVWGEWQRIEAEIPHIHFVGNLLHQQYSADPNDKAIQSHMLRFCTNTSLYLSEWTDTRSIGWLEVGLNISRQMNDAARERLLTNRLSMGYVMANRYEQARNTVEKSLDLSRTAKDIFNEAEALNILGLNSIFQDDSNAAEHHLREAYKLFQSINDKLGQARTANNIGTAMVRMSRNTEAIQQFEIGRQIFTELGYQRGATRMFINISVVQSRLGDYSGAKANMEQVLPLFMEMNDPRSAAQIEQNLGALNQYLGNHIESEYHSRKALELFEEINDWRGQAQVNINLGLLARYRGNFDPALNYYQRALDIFYQLESEQGVADSTFGFALISADLGDYDASYGYYQETITYYQRLGDRQGEGDALASLGLLLHQMDKNEQSLEENMAGLVIAQEIEDPSTQGYALTHMGHALLALGQMAQAEEHYQNALQIRLSLEENGLAAETCAGLVRIAQTRGDNHNMEQQLEMILNYLQSASLDGTSEPARIYLTCYNALKQLGDSRAKPLLDAGQQFIQARANSISDPAKQQSYLRRVRANAELISTWEAQRI